MQKSKYVLIKSNMASAEAMSSILILLHLLIKSNSYSSISHLFPDPQHHHHQCHPKHPAQQHAPHQEK